MIVKNEENVIERSLQSILPHVDTWVIVDTGSTDSTMEKIREITAAANKQGVLYQRPWVNFAHNRTEALELATAVTTATASRSAVTTATATAAAPWLFMLDADDIFHGLFPSLLDSGADAYTVQMRRSGLEYRYILLFNSKSHWVYKSPVHEYPSLENAKVLELPIVWVDSRAEGARSRNPNKYSDDATLLEQEFHQNPANLRAAFYAAQSWRDAGNSEKAIYWYYIRAASGGWAQEQYVSYLNLIRLEIRIDIKFTYAWKALELCPGRLEATHAVLEECRNKNEYSIQSYALASATDAAAREAATKQRVTSLFMESDIYKYKFNDEFSLVSFYTNHKKEAADAGLKAYISAPSQEKERIFSNLEYFRV
jgi:glycosyltransferase involved in cell wall biosynthesis